MTYKEAHDWCLKNEVTVFFQPDEGLIGGEFLTTGKVKFQCSQGGSGGDTLPMAVENWIKSFDKEDSLTSNKKIIDNIKGQGGKLLGKPDGWVI